MSMEVLSARSALLSNFEVLTLLRELENDQLAKQKTAIRIKKEEEERVASSLLSQPQASSSSSVIGSTLQTLGLEEVSENLRTVEFEAIQYLTASYQPMHRQSEASISKLVKDLAPYELTKAEKLQIVNLTPTEPVELYVIVEEIEDRLGDRMNEVLDVVRNSLSGPSNADVPDPVHRQQAADWNEGDTLYDDDRPEWEDGADAGAEEELFDDMGEGAGIEGDLEMDDD